MQPAQSHASFARGGLAVAPFAVVTLLGGAGIVTTALPKKRRALTGSLSDVGDDDLQFSDRIYVCPVCSNIMPRDKNATINILEEWLRILKENMFRPSVEGYSKPFLITTIA